MIDNVVYGLHEDFLGLQHGHFVLGWQGGNLAKMTQPMKNVYFKSKTALYY